MATNYSRKSSSGPVMGFRRSSSPSGRFSSSSSGFASSSTSFSSRSTTGFFHPQRSTSPTRVNMSSQSVRFSMVERSLSPSRSISAAPQNQVVRKQSHPLSAPQKRTCMCSPTNHPGSFRCALHKTQSHNNNQAASCTSSRLNARRSAMANSLVRIGTVEGDWVKRALAALIRPSSHHQKRRAGFQSRPSRLSVVSH